MKECQVCYEQKHKRDFKGKYSSRCKHKERTVCNDCLYRGIKQAFSEMCNDNVRCPEENCNVVFRRNMVKKILLASNDSKLLEKYDQFLLHQKLGEMKEFIWCAHGCGVGQLNEGRNRNNIVQCVGCHKKTCFKHKIKWHEGMTCKEYDSVKNPDDRATKRWIEKNCEKCPKCSAPIRKAHGCDHMTCTNCQHEFCWSCLADYNEIRKHGDHKHESTCKHYATDTDTDTDSDDD